MRPDRQRDRAGARREVHHRLDERSREEQHGPERHVLAERHQVHLLIHRRGLTIRAQDERGIEHPGHRVAAALGAAEQQVGAGVARQLTDRVPVRMVLEAERGSRLGPHDQPRSGRGALPAEIQIAAQNRRPHRRVPLVCLQDVALHQADTQRRAVPHEAVVRQPPDAKQHDHAEHPRGHRQHAHPVRAWSDQRQRQCAVDEHDEQRHAMHAEQAGQLGHRQHARLAVAEELPGKTTEQPHPTELGREPDRRGTQQPPRTPSRAQQHHHDHGERRRKERQVGDQQTIEQHTHRQGEPAELDHDLGEPGQGAGKVDRAGRQPQTEREPG